MASFVLATDIRFDFYHSVAAMYMKAVLSQPDVNDWIDKAQDEPWVIEQYENEAA